MLNKYSNTKNLEKNDLESQDDKVQCVNSRPRIVRERIVVTRIRAHQHALASERGGQRCTLMDQLFVRHSTIAQLLGILRTTNENFNIPQHQQTMRKISINSASVYHVRNHSTSKVIRSTRAKQDTNALLAKMKNHDEFSGNSLRSLPSASSQLPSTSASSAHTSASAPMQRQAKQSIPSFHSALSLNARTQQYNSNASWFYSSFAMMFFLTMSVSTSMLSVSQCSDDKNPSVLPPSSTIKAVASKSSKPQAIKDPKSTPKDIGETKPKEASTIPVSVIDEKKEETKNEKENSEEVKEKKSDEKNYAALFLDKESVTNLRNRFPTKFQETEDVSELYHHVTLAFDPPEDVLASYAVQMGRPAVIQVIAIVSDDKCETAFVKIHPEPDEKEEENKPSADGESPAMSQEEAAAAEEKAQEEAAEKKRRRAKLPKQVKSKNKHPHITLSLSNGAEAKYSNELLEIVANKFPERFQEDAEKQDDLAWEGEIDGKTYKVKFIENEMFLVTGTVCLKSKWSDQASQCDEETKCGFCRFMKAGPCGEQFQAWEKCIDEGGDYVERCIPQTRALKDCVDAHPLYYYSVVDKDEEEEEAKKKSDVTPPPVTEETSKEEKKNDIEAEQEVFEEVEENAITHQKEQNS